MPKQRPKREVLLERLVLLTRPVESTDLDSLREALAPVSESHLRRLLRESGHPLAPLVEGVRQDSPEALERTLLGLLDVYESGQARAARQCVIDSRQHARFALRRNPSPGRAEAILWMTVWLENPPVFRTWVALRKATAARSLPPSPGLP